MLGGLGIVFSDEFFIFESDGALVERGTLSSNETFRQALSASKSASSFEHIALRSAEVNAINNALNAGSDPSDLVTAPVMIFLDPPTEDGREKVQLFTKDCLGAPKPQKKPWWKLL